MSILSVKVAARTASTVSFPIDLGVVVVYKDDMPTQNDEIRIKKVKHRLVDKGNSFRAWCREKGVPHSVARDLIYGRLTGNKSENIRLVRRVLEEEFGEDLFDL